MYLLTSRMIDNNLVSLDNVVATSHTAGATVNRRFGLWVWLLFQALLIHKLAKNQMDIKLSTVRRETKMIEQIKEIIEQDINPQLQLHAGGCELIDVDDGIVTLRLYGGCSGCPSSQIAFQRDCSNLKRNCRRSVTSF